jgi:hypothetical protein
VGSSALLIDSGAFFAILDGDDPHHASCRTLLDEEVGPLVLPVLTVAEIAHLVETRLDHETELRFLGDLVFANFIIESVHAADWLRIADLVARYRDLRLGTVDASVVAAAERLNIRRIATLDRRHFSVVRPRHVDAFELLPA